MLVAECVRVAAASLALIASKRLSIPAVGILSQKTYHITSNTSFYVSRPFACSRSIHDAAMPSDLWSQLPLIWYRQFFVTPPYPTTRWEDKTVIVTGANVGLGFEAARHFVRLGAAKVILAMRSIERGEKAKKSIEDGEKRPGIVQVWSLDLCSFDSVKAFARRATEELPRLDAVVENAGVIPTKFQLQEGHELTITTNVVATFLLMLLILPKLKETASRYNTQPHLSIISSDVHYVTDLPERSSPPSLRSWRTKRKHRWGTGTTSPSSSRSSLAAPSALKFPRIILSSLTS